MASQQNNSTTEISKGIVQSFIRIAMRVILFGIIIPGIIYIGIRFLEIAFGFGWKEQLTYQYMGYIYTVGYALFLVYMAIRNQLSTTLYYSIGWIFGLLLMFRLGIFTTRMFFGFLFVPVIFVIIKILYLIFKKKEKKVKRNYSP